MDHLKLTVDKLSVDSITDLVADDSCGAISLFVGTTRDNFQGKKVLRLEYEAYEPMALKSMKSICDEIRNKWPAIHSIAIYHRSKKSSETPPLSSPTAEETVDKNLIQINVSAEELQQRIQNFIERKREQVNISNIHDFIPCKGESETEDTETCARVRTQFVRRSGSKGHLKIRKVHNEWGPQTVSSVGPGAQGEARALPPALAERVLAAERFLNAGPVAPDIYRRLKDLEDKIAHLQTVSPEYAQFWKNNRDVEDVKQDNLVDYTFSADDIARKIDLLQKQKDTN